LECRLYGDARAFKSEVAYTSQPPWFCDLDKLSLQHRLEVSSVVIKAIGASWEELQCVVRISGGWQHLAVACKQVS
jgi:hypothetical protein